MTPTCTCDDPLTASLTAVVGGTPTPCDVHPVEAPEPDEEADESLAAVLEGGFGMPRRPTSSSVPLGGSAIDDIARSYGFTPDGPSAA